MFDLDNISVAYSDTPVLVDISLNIREGEKIVIIGASGAGKSTLLRKLYEMQKERAAFIHQDYALVPQLSAFHNVCIGRLDRHSTAYNLFNLIKPRKVELASVTPILESLGMPEKTFERVSSLSGGQQQRVAVARAVYREADALIGDEPVSSIDPHQAGAVLNLLKQRSKTLILAMHDVQLALEHFDRIVGLRLGRIVFDLPGVEVNDKILTDLYRPC
jgi:phosphonate transport system ATP-binding protein